MVKHFELYLCLHDKATKIFVFNLISKKLFIKIRFPVYELQAAKLETRTNNESTNTVHFFNFVDDKVYTVR